MSRFEPAGPVPGRNPHRRDPDHPSMRPSMRITRWLGLLALVALLVHGLVTSAQQRAWTDQLLGSATALHEPGTVTAVESTTFAGRASSWRSAVTVVTESGQVFEYESDVPGAYRLGDAVVVTHEEGNPVWVLENPERGHSSAEHTRNGMTRVRVALPAAVLAGIGVYFVVKWVRIRRWDAAHRG